MNDVTKTGNYNIAALNNLATNLGAVQQTITSSTGEPYLRMGKDGKWIYGGDSIEIEDDSEWAINPMSVFHGYVCWSNNDDGKANTKLGEVMVHAGEAKPPLASLPEHGWPWVEQVSLALACISGEDKGTQVKYSVASIGGMNEVKRLLGEMVQRINSEQQRVGSIDPDKSSIVPVVQLNHSHYIHKKYGKTYTPVINVVRWATLNGGEAPVEPKAKATPQAAPAAPPAEPAPQAQTRTRTRQRA